MIPNNVNTYIIINTFENIVKYLNYYTYNIILIIIIENKINECQVKYFILYQNG